MYGRIIKNDMQKSKMITATITMFILGAAMLTSLAALLIMNLLGAIDNMLILAKSPHIMQMHTGDVDMDRMKAFADAKNDVEEFQVLEFLNIDGSEIVINGNSLAWSVQDNGFSTQSKSFDYLLDLSGGVVRPGDGEIYCPIYYMTEGAAKVGDKVTIRGETFTVAGFLRDSQMNAALVSSKRFLVSDDDFEKIRSFGIMEHLIEFRIKDTSATSAFESEYLNAGLETNGPPLITYAQIRLINAITDGLMIAVLILISVLVIAVAFLCIRLTLIAKIEEDYREIGVMKVIGLRAAHIKRLYLAKYGAIAGTACMMGFLISLLISDPFLKNIRLYIGESNSFFTGAVAGFIGAIAIFLVVMLYINHVLNRFRRIPAAQAVRFGAPQEKTKLAKRFLLSKSRLISRNVFLGIKDVLVRKKLYVTMLSVLVISSFIVNIPQNIYNTISAKSFVTSMGIGSCDVYIEVSRTQTDDIPRIVSEITQVLANDASVSEYTVLTGMMFDMKTDSAEIQRLRVTLGNHSVFPIAYSKGRAPQTGTEIAISALYAEEMEKTVGDEIVILPGGIEKHLTICGVYSDLTNGGRTAKAVFETDQGDVLESSIPISFHDSTQAELKASQYMDMFAIAKVSVIDKYIGQIFGSTVAAIRVASYVSIAATVLLTVLVTLLFMKMLVTKDRYSIAVQKSLGFTGSEIRKQYITRSITILVPGVIIGTILANTLGEFVGVAIISSFGASTFNFVINPLFSYLFSPALIAVCVYIATLSGISDIHRLKISEYIKEA